ncbi:MAG: enoyl-CoA hydratase/isomerase family protein [Azonexus sp.]|jgi:2-(1,2-epoxy-1,2-dihydrophenyl)acetyl-CoA isomerase|nr:enoyl-CoA hydratase/isomerase family protein [Azonexus sp.]
MENEDILASLNEGVLTITLNRPDTHNACDMAMWGRLLKLLQDAAIDPEVRCVLLAGAGKSFCAGADVRSFGTIDTSDPMAVKYAEHPVWRDIELRTARLVRNCGINELLHSMGKPSIAAVRGAAAGAGLAIAAACDFRIASETASFVAAFARIGTSGDFGISYFLTHLIGPAKAREMLLLGDKVGAAKALEIGLVTRVVADAELDAEALALAKRLASGPPVAYRFIKQNILMAETDRMRDVMESEARHMMRALQTEDSKEAVRAFQEKREPKFAGR